MAVSGLIVRSLGGATASTIPLLILRGLNTAELLKAIICATVTIRPALSGETNISPVLSGEVSIEKCE